MSSAGASDYSKVEEFDPLSSGSTKQKQFEIAIAQSIGNNTPTATTATTATAAATPVPASIFTPFVPSAGLQLYHPPNGGTGGTAATATAMKPDVEAILTRAGGWLYCPSDPRLSIHAFILPTQYCVTFTKTAPLVFTGQQKMVESNAYLLLKPPVKPPPPKPIALSGVKVELLPAANSTAPDSSAPIATLSFTVPAHADTDHKSFAVKASLLYVPFWSGGQFQGRKWEWSGTLVPSTDTAAATGTAADGSVPALEYGTGSNVVREANAMYASSPATLAAASYPAMIYGSKAGASAREFILHAW